MPKAPKKVAPVPEHVLKKRKAQDAIAAARAAKLVEDKKASKIERKAIFDKAAKYDREYKASERDLVEKRRSAKKTGNFYMEPEPKVMLVVRIKGINAVDPKTRKILQLMRLRQVSAAQLPCMLTQVYLHLSRRLPLFPLVLRIYTRTYTHFLSAPGTSFFWGLVKLQHNPLRIYSCECIFGELQLTAHERTN